MLAVIFILHIPSHTPPTQSQLPMLAARLLLASLLALRFSLALYAPPLVYIETKRKSFHQPRSLVGEPFSGSAVQSRLVVVVPKNDCADNELSAPSGTPLAALTPQFLDPRHRVRIRTHSPTHKAFQAPGGASLRLEGSIPS